MVGADHSAVDHLDRLWCRPTIGQGLQQKIPQSSSAPSKELAIDGIPFAELFGQIAPGSAGARDPEYTVQCAPMIARRTAAQGACGNDKWLESAQSTSLINPRIKVASLQEAVLNHIAASLRIPL